MDSVILQKRIRGICCLTAEPHDGLSYEDMVMHAIEGGASVIQFRAKELSGSEMYLTGKKLAVIARENGAVFIVNDRVDAALAVGADGVHVGSEDFPLDEVKNIAACVRTRGDFIVGYSTHSLEQALEAAAAGAGYISIGPIFETPAKPLNPLGTGAISVVKKHVKIPVVAIGGINAGNIAQVMAAGADAAAVIRAGCGAKDVRAAVAELRSRIP